MQIALNAVNEPADGWQTNAGSPKDVLTATAPPIGTDAVATLSASSNPLSFSVLFALSFAAG
ncbi:MAG: hypothetical protein ABI276_01305, partial [Acidimicrobiales bacterium]